MLRKPTRPLHSSVDRFYDTIATNEQCIDCSKYPVQTWPMKPSAGWPMSCEYKCWNDHHLFSTPAWGIPVTKKNGLYGMLGYYCSYACARCAIDRRPGLTDRDQYRVYLEEIANLVNLEEKFRYVAASSSCLEVYMGTGGLTIDAYRGQPPSVDFRTAPFFLVPSGTVSFGRTENVMPRQMGQSPAAVAPPPLSAAAPPSAPPLPPRQPTRKKPVTGPMSNLMSTKKRKRRK